MRPKNLLDWAGHSLFGHVVFLQISLSLPLFTIFAWLFYADGRLTLMRLLGLAAVASILGAITAIIAWYTIWLPFLKTWRKGR
jgi:hypothetical protein